jgi:hypothetical protein
VYRQDASTTLAASRQDVPKHGNLDPPISAVLGTAIKADLAHVRRVRQQVVEEVKLVLTLMSKLRVEAERGEDRALNAVFAPIAFYHPAGPP